jgi:hypothetical protein
MKTIAKLNSLALLFVVLSIGGCKKEESTYSYSWKVIKNSSDYDNFVINGLTQEEVAQLKGEPGVKVKFYSSEIGLRTDKNKAFEVISDSEGIIRYERKSAGAPEYFIFAELGEFNNYRFRYSNNAFPVPNDKEVLPLTLTPSRLQIQVLTTTGLPISNAIVEVYPSEEDYINKVENYKWLAKYPEYGGNGLNAYWIYKQTSDSNGIVKFESLAPRIFWFRVTPPFPYKNNDNGYNKLAAPLPDNPEVYFVTTVVLTQ